MKNISLIFNAVLLVAVIVLFVLVCRLNKIHSVDGEMYGPDSTLSVQLPVAYVNVDSLLLNYQFAIESNEILMKNKRIPDWIWMLKRVNSKMRWQNFNASSKTTLFWVANAPSRSRKDWWGKNRIYSNWTTSCHRNWSTYNKGKWTVARFYQFLLNWIQQSQKVWIDF